jgi:hypothetical protein
MHTIVINASNGKRAKDDIHDSEYSSQIRSSFKLQVWGELKKSWGERDGEDITERLRHCMAVVVLVFNRSSLVRALLNKQEKPDRQRNTEQEAAETFEEGKNMKWLGENEVRVVLGLGDVMSAA